MTRRGNDQDDLFPWEKDESASMDASAAAPPAPPAPPHQRLDANGIERPERDARVHDSRDESTDTAAASRDRPVAPREYYSIIEVCELVDLKPHVLRYWETQFGPLNPSKNRSGNRVYQKKEIRLILLVKHLLYEEKYTVEGARAKLDQLRRSGRLPDVTAKAMTHDTAALVRSELEQVLAILTPART
jgi:DNA-binding transcriptional MerR regulator